MVMNTDFKIKLASLGMMRRDYMTDYAKLNWLSNMPFAMPIRWMAPESLKIGNFSSQSDVWSFGIVLYEIFSFGNRPWAEFSNDNVIELVASKAHTLPKPIDCPENIYQVMKECWSVNPDNRPNFEKLKDKFMSGEIFEENASTIGGGTGTVGTGHNNRHMSEISGIGNAPSNVPTNSILGGHNGSVKKPTLSQLPTPSGIPNISPNNQEISETNGFTPLLNGNGHGNGHSNLLSPIPPNNSNIQNNNSNTNSNNNKTTPSTSLQSASLSNYSNCGQNNFLLGTTPQKKCEVPSSILGFSNMSEHLNL